MYMDKSSETTHEFIDSEECFVDDDLIISTSEDFSFNGGSSSSNLFKSFLERDNFETELGTSLDDPFGEDFSDISIHDIIEVFGEDLAGRPVVIFYAYRLPCNKSFDHPKFLRFIEFTLNKLVDQDYIVIYFHYGLRSNNKPPLKWLLDAYRLLDRRYKKNLKALYMVHPTNFIRFLWNVFKPLISIKFGQKIHYLNSLRELNTIIPIEQINIPQPILDCDLSNKVEKNLMNNARPKSPPRPTQQFDVSLQFILNHNSNYDVPPIVIDLITFIRQYGLKTEGIFRRSASLKDIETLINRINGGEKIDFLNDSIFLSDKERAVIFASALLKRFLRSLGEPVITNKLYTELAQINGINKENRPAAVRELISKLEPENYILLKMIIEFLVEVTQHSHENLMDANNLSIVFGPNLTWPTDQQVPMLQLNNLNSFCYTMIKCYDDVFVKS